MARRILDAGFPLTVWARRAETLADFAAAGAVIASTRRSLGEQAQILCVCVVDDADVEDVLRGPDGALAAMPAGGVVVLHSTIAPSTCHRLRDEFPHLDVIDAPVSGGGHKAAVGELLVMVGGPAEPVERCRPVFATFANRIVHVGELGSGQQAKLLNNTMFTAHLALCAEAFAIALRLGLDGEAFADVLTTGSGRSYATEVLAPRRGSLAGMAATAGPLLAKDVGLLERLVPGTSLVDVADEAVRAMGLPGRGQS